MVTLADWVWTLLTVFMLCVIVRIVLSWVTIAPIHPWPRRIVEFFHDTTDWYLRFFRRIIPAAGPLDLSPMAAILVLIIVQRFLNRIILSFA